MTEPAAPPSRIVGRQPQASRTLQILTVILAAFYLCWIVWQAERLGNWLLPALWLVAIVGSAVYRRRPPTTIDHDGIRLPWRKRTFIPWSEVKEVVAPQPGVYWAKLLLTDGKTKSLPDVPATESAAVAALGDKPLARPVHVTLPPPRPAPRTDRDIEVDVTRRAQILADRSRQLDAEYQRIRRGSSTPTKPASAAEPDDVAT